MYCTFEDHSEYSQGAWCPVSVTELQASTSHAFWDSGLLANEQDSPDVMQVTVRFRIPRPHVAEHWNAQWKIQSKLISAAERSPINLHQSKNCKEI